MANVFRTVIVPSGTVTALKNTLKNNEDYRGLDGMFTTPMSLSGNSPATHYVSSGWMTEEEDAFLTSVLPKPFQGNEEGEGAFDTFARLGLKIINEEPI